jgi:hypothetical protein
VNGWRETGIFENSRVQPVGHGMKSVSEFADIRMYRTNTLLHVGAC